MSGLATTLLIAGLLFSAPVSWAVDLGDASKVFEVDTLEKVATGFKFTEGPVWHPDGFVLFSDIPSNHIVRWAPGEGHKVFRDPSHHSNGLTYDRQGRLVAAEHGARRVSRTNADGEIEVLAERFEGKRFNSPNDVVVANDGRVYFTDPPYGLKDGDTRELDFCGVYFIDTEGNLSLEYGEFKRPNGLALSPDEKTLYVAESNGKNPGLNLFPVGEDGHLGTPKKFGTPLLPWGDGMKVDGNGNVYATSSEGIWIWDKDGGWIGILEVPEGPANCAFGGADGKDFFITAKKSLYKVRCKVPGILPLAGK